MQKKLEKKFFDFKIILFELVALNTCFYWERILFLRCQYVDSLKISDTTKTEFSCWFFFRVIKERDKNNTLQI